MNGFIEFFSIVHIEIEYTPRFGVYFTLDCHNILNENHTSIL